MSDSTSNANRHHNSTGLRKIATLSFGVVVTGLIIFNTSVIAEKSTLKPMVADLQSQDTTTRKQLLELKSLTERHQNETLRIRATIERRLTEIHRFILSADDFFPILENQFVISESNGPYKSGVHNVFIAVPKEGRHQIKIQVCKRNKTIHEKRIDLQSGKAYRANFVLEENMIRVKVDGEEPFAFYVDGYFSTHSVATRTIPVLLSPNQPQYKVWQSRLPIKNEVLLSEFRCLTRSSNFDDSFELRIIAESDGPSFAAADDPDIVAFLLLNSDHGSLGDGISYRFEDGRYVFESLEQN